MSKIVFLKTLQTLLTPLKRLIDRKAENVNWNENDPSASGYIANRPFYKEIKNADLILSMDITFSEYWNVTELPVFNLIRGETYTVVFDGVEYQCVAVDDGYGGEALGNFYLIGEGADTGEPFFIYEEEDGEWTGIMIPIEEEVTCTIQISGKQAIIHKIDSQYLPKIEAGLGIRGTGGQAEVFNGGNPEQASGIYSHAEGNETTASGAWAHAEGYETTASGNGSHAEGGRTVSSGQYTHAEGADTEAASVCTHAEGRNTKALHDCDHAEGSDTEASGGYSHSEGKNTKALASCSHAEGLGTIASGQHSHVEGKYNVEDKLHQYLHITGNGTSESVRSNAYTLHKNGVGWFAGGLKVGGTGQDDAAAVEVATKPYVDEAISNNIRLIDETSGATYKLYVDNGKLSMMEVE